MLEIEVVYASSVVQEIVKLRVDDKTTVFQAIELSGFREKYALQLSKTTVGIYNTPTQLDALLEEHDRIVIYSPLLQDPKKLRMKRLKQQQLKACSQLS